MLVVSLFLVSCQNVVKQQPAKVNAEVKEVPKTEEVPEANKNVVPEIPKVEEKVSCEVTSDCDEGLLCIDGECGVIADLYNTDCENKCTIKSVTVLTSDGETYTLKLGQGSYSYAGALEWRLLSTPEYCQGDDPLVPIRLIKKSYGEILEKEVITLHKGETSDVITHPTVGSVKFTATLKDVEEDCS